MRMALMLCAALASGAGCVRLLESSGVEGRPKGELGGKLEVGVPGDRDLVGRDLVGRDLNLKAERSRDGSSLPKDQSSASEVAVPKCKVWSNWQCTGNLFNCTATCSGSLTTQTITCTNTMTTTCNCKVGAVVVPCGAIPYADGCAPCQSALAQACCPGH